MEKKNFFDKNEYLKHSAAGIRYIRQYFCLSSFRDSRCIRHNSLMAFDWLNAANDSN